MTSLTTLSRQFQPIATRLGSPNKLDQFQLTQFCNIPFCGFLNYIPLRLNICRLHFSTGTELLHKPLLPLTETFSFYRDIYGDIYGDIYRLTGCDIRDRKSTRL